MYIFVSIMNNAIHSIIHNIKYCQCILHIRKNLKLYSLKLL